MRGQFRLPRAATRPITVAEARFRTALLEQREQADSRIFWLLVAQWAVILSTSMAMATRWPGTRLDTLSAAIIWVGVLSAVPLALVLRAPGSLAARWTVGITQACMSTLLWYISGGQPDTHLHLFAWLVALALYRDLALLLVSAACALAGDAVVYAACQLPALTAHPDARFATTVWLAWLLGATAFLIAFILLDRQSLAAQAERTQALESLQQEFQAKTETISHKLAEERDQFKRQASELSERQIMQETARLELSRELLSLRRDVSAEVTSLVRALGRLAERAGNSDWRLRCEDLQKQARQILKHVQVPPADLFDDPPRNLSEQSHDGEKRAMLLMRNPLQQNKAQAVLEAEGYKVDVVANGPRTYYSVMLNDYSLIVVDIDLPGDEGFDTLEALRLLPPDRLGKSKCLFAVTAEKTAERVLRCTELGVDGIFLKPLRQDALHQALSDSMTPPPAPQFSQPKRDSKAGWTSTAVGMR